MKRIIAALALVLLPGAITPSAAFAGVSGPAFYVDGVVYRTVGTPTDLSGKGAPDHTFDVIYEFDGAQLNVAEAAPGDTDYNGGRWRVHLLAFNTDYATSLAAHDANMSGDFDSDAEVAAALADPGPAGATDEGVVKTFVCPVIKL